MAGMPVLVIGLDPVWRARMQRMLAPRGELDWRGAYKPGQRRRTGEGAAAALLLLDGDDPMIERDSRRPLLPPPRRLYFYRHPTVDALHHSVSAGAHGCLDKLATPETVLRALRAIEADLFAVAPALLIEALHAAGNVPLPVDPPGDWSALTERQREIVRWAARGMSNKQIARQLGISPETVKTHLHHVFAREGVHGRIELLAAHQDDDAVPPRLP